MLKRKIRPFFLIFFISQSYANISIDEDYLLQNMQQAFGNLEHQQLGDAVILRFDKMLSSQEKVKLHLNNGMLLSYGEILSLAGDFFGDETVAISSCNNKEAVTCFLQHFHDLDRQGEESDTDCHSAFYQKKAYFKIFKETSDYIENQKQKGIPAYQSYEKIADKLNGQYNRVSCGGSTISSLIPYGKYIRLAKNNFDHFAPSAIDAYKAGHEQALQQAQNAYQAWHDEQDSVKANRSLEFAYAQNAYASHFLTDTFSSGHIRVPRREINQQTTMPQTLQLLLANFMHDEDNVQGLKVTNDLGDEWQAFGDGYLDEPKAQKHKQIIIQALQASANQIFLTYQSGQLPKEDITLHFLPQYNRLADLNNTAPLFKLNTEGVLLRRISLTNHYNFSYTSQWSGLITLAKLELLKKLHQL